MNTIRRRGLYVQLRSQQTYTSDNHDQIKGSPAPNLVVFFANALSSILLMRQHKFHCDANLISRCGRTWNTNQTTPMYLKPFFSSFCFGPHMYTMALGHWTKRTQKKTRQNSEGGKLRYGECFGIRGTFLPTVVVGSNLEDKKTWSPRKD